ncbi:nuclease [PVC group bacterium (ex Bugula neritina AB1)]|nr:nuclease [PVC group bacterium (ex Bugula neritina AB1)]
MQKYGKDQIFYSPSDLVTFLGCHHASFLDVRALSEDMDRSEISTTGQLLQKKGLEHEAAYLEELKSEGKTVVEIPKDRDLSDRTKLTIEALQSGVDVIYQGVFFVFSKDKIGLRGDADFLMKCDTPSALGDFSYEVLDTKLARTAEPKHIIQLCVYSELLTSLQGLRPANMHLLLGDHKKHSFRVEDFYYYYIRAKRRFERYLQSMPKDSYPEPCTHCHFCPWDQACKAQWEKNDHLSLVANIQRAHMKKLHKFGIRTLAGLARTDDDIKIPDLSREVFLRLRSQAALQHHKITTGDDKCEIIPFPEGKGFDRMPVPDEGDLFFDMEGDPLYPNGLEYLFGVYYLKGDQKIFKPFWAHDHEEEKETFKRFMGFLEDHLVEYPNAYIYHYNHYETTALKRLACRYAVCEEQLDNLLRQQKFIDLYLVVRESLRTSESGYSIKNMETFYMDKRDNAVATAADSIIVYNQWRETGEDKLLQEISDYNEVDCVSTHLLRDWLLKLRPEDTVWFKSDSEYIQEGELQRKEWEIEYEDYQSRLGVTEENPLLINERLSHLLEFHNREAKPQWWKSFERQNKFEDELIDDTECLAGLQKVGTPEQEKRSLIYTYRFPSQEYKLKVGSQAVDIAEMKTAGTILAIDEDDCMVKIKRGAKKEPLPDRLSVGPSGPIDSKIIRTAIYRYADQLIESADSTHASTELLSKNVPRIEGKPKGEQLIQSDDLQGDALGVIAALKNSYLFIQGPPGSGKTFTSSHIIVELINRGKKIGITSNSHKAIHNLLEKVENVATEKRLNFHGIKKASRSNEETFFDGKFIHSETKTDNMSLDADLFAGTAWTFASDHFSGKLDYLFIDEAGQVATANVVAMATAANNIILVGDQMQLGQPIQGTHPGEAGLSVLEFLLGDHSTIPADRGIFLGQTRRMRPSICEFISNAFYDGRLTAHADTVERSLNLQGIDLPNEGIVMIKAEHEGCSQKSIEEGEIIKAKYEALLGQKFRDKDDCMRPIVKEDILVVTPYNVQVNHLRSILSEGAKVGTVDKFQGQEAPIVLISMVTSSAEDLPRNIEFLYSKNRLNVAVSRAKCLAVVVANPKLLEIPCGTVEEMKLVNTFCWLDVYTSGQKSVDT